MLESYANFCYDQIGGYALELLDYFEDLRPQLSKANISVSLPEYVSAIIFSTFAVLISSLILLAPTLAILSGPSGFILGIVFSLVLTAITFLSFYLLPSILIRNRASKIQDSLPFATIYMSTLAGTGTSVSEIFSIMGEVEEYGEVSKEAEKISKDIDNFGMDVSQALEKAAERSPSEEFGDLMWGMNHVITSGGSLREFLEERSDKLMDDYQRRIETYAEQLSLMVEMYITLVIVGSIVFTSLSVVMSSFTSMAGEKVVLIQIAAIFLVLPFLSAMFILIVKGMSPGGVR